MKLPWMTIEEIELQADMLRNQLKKHLGSNDEFGFDNELYLDLLVRIEKLDHFTYTDTDGINDKIIGRYNWYNNDISIYKAIDTKGKENFTVAHEIGHCILHGPLFKSFLRNHNIKILELQESFYLQRDSVEYKILKQLKKGINAIEVQANIFACFLLMPRNPFKQTYLELMNANDLDIGHFIDFSTFKASRNILILYEILDKLAHIFETTDISCINQLKNLELIDNTFVKMTPDFFKSNNSRLVPTPVAFAILIDSGKLSAPYFR